MLSVVQLPKNLILCATLDHVYKKIVFYLCCSRLFLSDCCWWFIIHCDQIVYFFVSNECPPSDQHMLFHKSASFSFIVAKDMYCLAHTLKIAWWVTFFSAEFSFIGILLQTGSDLILYALFLTHSLNTYYCLINPNHLANTVGFHFWFAAELWKSKWNFLPTNLFRCFVT
jgi:hypothetical protein